MSIFQKAIILKWHFLEPPMWLMSIHRLAVYSHMLLAVLSSLVASGCYIEIPCSPVPISCWSMVTVPIVKLPVCPWPLTIDSLSVPISHSSMVPVLPVCPLSMSGGISCNSRMAAVMGGPFPGGYTESMKSKRQH